MSVKRLLQELDSAELSEWMAYDMTNNQEWVDKYNKDCELEASNRMTDAERLEAFKKLFKGKNG